MRENIVREFLHVNKLDTMQLWRGSNLLKVCTDGQLTVDWHDAEMQLIHDP